MKTLTVLTLLAAFLALASGRRLRNAQGGGGRAVGRGSELHEEAAAGSSLKAGERSLDAQEAELSKAARRKERIDKRNQRKERKQERARVAAAERLAAEASVDYENYQNEARFNNLDAAANKEVADKFGMSVLSENRHDESAAISSSDGKKQSSGTRFAADNFIDTAAYNNAEHEASAESFDGDALSAAGAEEDEFRAQEGFKKAHESILDAEQYSEQNVGLADNTFGRNDGGFGRNSGGFGSSNGGFGSKNGGFGSKNGGLGSSRGLFGNSVFGGFRK